LAAEGQLGLAVAIGQKAVVADALKTVRQDMQQEATNELVGLEVMTFGWSWWR
jgi:hypothetical protein